MDRLTLPVLSGAVTLAVNVGDWSDLATAVAAAVLSAVLNWLLNRRKDPKP